MFSAPLALVVEGYSNYEVKGGKNRQLTKLCYRNLHSFFRAFWKLCKHRCYKISNSIWNFKILNWNWTEYPFWSIYIYQYGSQHSTCPPLLAGVHIFSFNKLRVPKQPGVLNSGLVQVGAWLSPSWVQVGWGWLVFAWRWGWRFSWCGSSRAWLRFVLRLAQIQRLVSLSSSGRGEETHKKLSATGPILWICWTVEEADPPESSR